MKTTICLADDHAIVRQGLKAIINSQADMKVAGEAEDGVEALEMVKNIGPDVLVLDIAMPKLDGLRTAQQVNKESPSTRVLLLSSYGSEEYVDEALKMKVAGYLLKESASHELLQAVREVMKGNTYFCPSIAKRIQGRIRECFQNGDKKPKSRHLTEREREVLRLLAEGNANKMVADKLGISIKTVEKHRQAMMHKLNIHEIAGLTRYALERGIIQVNRG
jgi:DNA-binding NarL/FixJ family response regulator